jgi:hypothetical protein
MYDGLKETFFICESFVHVPPGSQEAGQHAGRRLVQDRAAAKGMGRRMGGGRRRVASGRLVAWAIYSAGAGVAEEEECTEIPLISSRVRMHLRSKVVYPFEESGLR